MTGHECYAWLNNCTQGALTQLEDMLPKATSIYLVGGAVRDFYLKRPPSDLDVTVEGMCGRDLESIPGAKRNAFNGPVIPIGDYWVDIWPVPETFFLKDYGLPFTIEGVLSRFVFNLEKIALELRSKNLIDRGCTTGISHRVINYEPHRPFKEPIQAARCVILKRKTNFSYSQTSRELILRSKTQYRNPKVWQEVVEFISLGGKYHDLLEEIHESVLS